jgi:hypothetical protein
MRCAMAGLLLMLGPLSAWANEGVYVGTWKTTNRKLDGAMTCAVKDLGDEKWQGRFFGIWQGVPFDYTVAFAGRPSDLRGTATIDGASYTWTGTITSTTSTSAAPRIFKGAFGGSRYVGSFELKEKSAEVAAQPAVKSTVR